MSIMVLDWIKNLKVSISSTHMKIFKKIELGGCVTRELCQGVIAWGLRSRGCSLETLEAIQEEPDYPQGAPYPPQGST